MNQRATSSPAAPQLISMVVHSRNNEAHLRSCLDSLLAQTHRNLEIIVYDFASEDGSWDIITEFQRRHPGLLTSLRLRKDYYPDALVDHMQNVRGKYFMRFHASCLAEPELIERCLGMIGRNAATALVRIRTRRIGDSNEEILEPPLYEASTIAAGRDHIPRLLMTNPDPFSTVAFYNSDIMKLHAGNSVYLTELKLATRYGIGYLHEPLFTIQRPARQNIGDALAHYFQLYLDKCNFTRQATIDGMKELDATCAEAIGELANILVGKSRSALSDGCLVSAKQWFHLATAMAPKIEQEEAFQSLAADLERTADITRENA